MANIVFPKYKEALQKKLIDVLNDTIVVYGVTTSGGAENYTYDAATEVLADIHVDARVAVSAALTGKTLTVNRFDSNDAVFPSVPAGPAFQALILYDQTADRVMSYHDGFTETPDGNNINITVSGTGWYDL